MFRKDTTRLIARFLIGNHVCKGIVSDLSENRLILHSKCCLPCDETFSIMLFYRKKRIVVTARMGEVRRSGSTPSSVSVTVVNPSVDYLSLVYKLRPLRNSCQILLSPILKQRGRFNST